MDFSQAREKAKMQPFLCHRAGKFLSEGMQDPKLFGTYIVQWHKTVQEESTVWPLLLLTVSATNMWVASPQWEVQINS